MEEFEYAGIWWLPEDPDNTISGTLKFDPTRGSNLKLIGSFKENKDFNTFLAPNIILGITSDGKRITLYKCRESGSQMGIPGFLSSFFVAQVIFVGHHFEREEDIVFDSLSLTYFHLEEWTRITGIKVSVITDSNSKFEELEISYIHPKDVKATIDDFHISIDFSLNLSGDRIKKCVLEQTTIIKIEPHKQIHFNHYRKNICYHIQNFLSLAIGEAVYPLTIKGKTEACKMKTTDNKIIYNNISIFYSMKRSAGKSKTLYPDDIFFLFEDISDDFEKYLNKWFAKSEILSPVYDLYFGTLYNPSMYLEHQFLSLIQALESYHRRVYGGKYLSDSDYIQIYEDLIKAIPKEIDNNFRESLKQKLRHHNEFSLRKRLNEILKICGDVISLLICDKKEFVNDLVDTRNFLVHYDRDLEKRVKKNEELLDIVLKMKFILQICFLIELGMPMNKMRDLISRNKGYQQLAKILNSSQK